MGRFGSGVVIAIVIERAFGRGEVIVDMVEASEAIPKKP
jgi:hypothetical protein